MTTTRGLRYQVVRPTLADFVLKMPRGAQVIYPKDLGPILMLADIFPGARVLESGIGSGALSMTMLRAGRRRAPATSCGTTSPPGPRPTSRRSSVPRRSSATRVEERDSYEGIDATGFDRVVLDLPEPWQVVKHAEAALRARAASSWPTRRASCRCSQLREALAASRFRLAETVEVLNRTWHVEGQAVRPDHRMVAHTGFLTHARLLGVVSGP